MKKIKCIFNIIITFLLIISCSSSNKEYKEVISTNSYKITNRIQIARVHFDFNKFNLTRDFIENAILIDLRTNTNILKLYIYGHTDNKGKDWWNYRLGLHRALTVSNIISTNYTSENIILKSFSYSNSIADNRTENGRYSNRRADIFIDLVEETLEIQTNLIKVDNKNEFNILSRFNIDLRILLILLLLIILIAIIVIIIRFNVLAVKSPIKNKADGLRREREVGEDLEEEYPEENGYSIESEVYLRDENGNIVKDKETGEARRIDYIVIRDGEVIDSIEVTSKTADKTEQLAKEERIRGQGGNYIKDSNGNLVAIRDEVKTRIERRD